MLIVSVQFPLLGASHIMTDYAGSVFPADHALNTPINTLPVHPNSDNFINSIGKSTALHPDFGTSWDDDGVLRPMGIPYNVVGANQPKVPITFTAYDDESDPGPWPIPANPFIETVADWRDTTEGDRHMLVADSSSRMLYETGGTRGNSSGTVWEGGCGAVFDLNSYKLRPATWTSADAAGLPIFPLLIRYDEVDRALATGGEIPHAIRFTINRTQKAYLWPARHYASSSTDKNYPPMGLRFRMKAGVDISGFSPRMQVILRTMKKYGMIVSDNGSNWYFQGTHDDRWDDEEINTLKKLHGSDFEAVDIDPWITRAGFDANSAKVPPASGVIATSPGRPGKNVDGIRIALSPAAGSSLITVAFSLKTGGMTSIKIFDCSGRELRTLANRMEVSGLHSLQWDGKDARGGTVGSSLCFIQLSTVNGTVSQRLGFLR